MIEYWNRSQIVSHFSSLEPPEYWVKKFEPILDKSKNKVLDVGCGGGRNLFMLLKMGYDVYGCDYYENMVIESINKITNIINTEEAKKRVIQADMKKLPYKDSTFDYVIANGILHNVSNVDDYVSSISQLGRVLKNNGELCLNVFTANYIDVSLKKINEVGLFRTEEGLNMFLLPSNIIIKLLEKNNLYLTEEKKEYNSKVFSGSRSVLRAIFYKRI
jgi:ubiquinone/menaquinone biosynthesis C-methylase UbiE